MICPSKRVNQISVWRLCELKDAGAKYIPEPVLVVQTVCTCTECSIANTYNIGWQVETFLIEFSSSKYNKQVMRVWTHQGIRVTMSLYLRRLTSKTKKLVFFKHKDLIHFFFFYCKYNCTWIARTIRKKQMRFKSLAYEEMALYYPQPN